MRRQADKQLKINFTFSIQEQGEYGGGVTKLSITVRDDMVPQDTDAASYLRDRINAEFSRVTGQIPLPKVTVTEGPQVGYIPSSPSLS